MSENQMKYEPGVHHCKARAQSKYIHDGTEKLILELEPTHLWHIPEGGKPEDGSWVPVAPVPIDQARGPSVWLSAGNSAKGAKYQARQRLYLGFRGSFQDTSDRWESCSLVGENVMALNKANDYNGKITDSWSIVNGVEPPTQKVNVQKASQQEVLANAAMQELLIEEGMVQVPPATNGPPPMPTANGAPTPPSPVRGQQPVEPDEIPF